MESKGKRKLSPLREYLHEIIYEADTPAGKGFDIVLLIIISASVIIVMLETVDSLNSQYGAIFLFS